MGDFDAYSIGEYHRMELYFASTWQKASAKASGFGIGIAFTAELFSFRSSASAALSTKDHRRRQGWRFLRHRSPLRPAWARTQGRRYLIRRPRCTRWNVLSSTRGPGLAANRLRAIGSTFGLLRLKPFWVPFFVERGYALTRFLRFARLHVIL